MTRGGEAYGDNLLVSRLAPFIRRKIDRDILKHVYALCTVMYTYIGTHVYVLCIVMYTYRNACVILYVPCIVMYTDRNDVYVPCIVMYTYRNASVCAMYCNVHISTLSELDISLLVHIDYIYIYIYSHLQLN